MPDDEGEGAQCVKVAVRCRPPSNKEIGNDEKNIVEMNEAFTPEDGNGGVVLNDPAGVEEPAKFAFDIVFGLTVTQEQVYESVGRPALDKTFEGYNGTIFAYGQTGSGKSFSMAGIGDGDLRGITPRMTEELFKRIKKNMEENSTQLYLVMVSYFEIYNEIIFDLLNPVADRSKLGGGLQIKEHPVMGIYVKDLTEIVAEDSKKLEGLLESGNKCRAVASTQMNNASSRSHSIFTIKVHQKDTEDPSRNVFAKLNLVDLAGSERQKGTGATGQTLKEGANINKSLSALGNVINALVESANGKKVFIPYRNSKLTRVLQESLGGNSLCSMLAALSPAACNYEETMSTLRYANRAKSIKVAATKNEEASQISRLKAEVDELKKKVAGSGAALGGVAGLSDSERNAEKEKFEAQLRDMEKMMNSNWENKAKVSEEHERQLQKLKDEQMKAALAVEEERARRLKLLQEKNDPEMSIRGIIDFVIYLPKSSNTSSVLTGELPRHWLKTHRSLRQQVDELKEQRTMVLVFKHAFDEDVKLWGEGVEASDMSLAATGLSRCLMKLDKLRKTGEKLLQQETEGFCTASELVESVRQAISDIDRFRQETADEEIEEANGADAAGTMGGGGKASERAALEEVNRMLILLQTQVQEKMDELAQLSCIEMGPTCELLIQHFKLCLVAEGPDAVADEECVALQALVSDPSLAVLPAGMPKKPLREYDPSDVLDTPETTEALLGQLIRWEGLCGGKARKSASELLARPPPKFILDVTVAVQAATGFPPDIEAGWPEAREERLDRFTRIAEAVGSCLGIAMDFFDPGDVLKGKEVPKTLRLMQLLAISAARRRTVASASASNAKKGLARPRELPALLNAMDSCLQEAKKSLEARRQAKTAAVEGADQSLEEKIAALEGQLEEETRIRAQQEEKLADMERQIQESRVEAKKVSSECELTTQSSDQVDPEQVQLDVQLQELQRDAANPQDISADNIGKILSSEIEKVQEGLKNAEEDVARLQVNHQTLEAGVAQQEEKRKHLEAEVTHQRQRCETEQELVGQSPDEQKLILDAQLSRQMKKAEQLEAQTAQMQQEAEERKASNLKLAAEKKEWQDKVEDAKLQIEIVTEERDSFRDAMEQLWGEKAAVEEELQDRAEGYINLSERLQTQQDETSDLEMLVEKKREEVGNLQRNGFSHTVKGGS